MTQRSSRDRVVHRRRWLWRLALMALVATTAFCAWGVVDERNYSHDVAAHYEASSGLVVRDTASPSGLTLTWEDREGQEQQYVLSRGERSDLSLRAGDHTQVRYNPETGDAFLQDEDGPAPWIPAVLGLISGGLLALVATRGKRWVHSVVDLPEGVVRLKTLPGAKAAYLRPTTDGLDLVLPRYFGDRVWTIPLAQVALVRGGLAEIDGWDGEADEGPVFAKPIVLAYLPTGMMTANPNALLVFARPVRVPLLKRVYAIPGATRDLPFSYREIKRGVTIDGLELRAQDATDLERVLRAAAVPVIYDPDAWLAEHRELVHDEQKRAALVAFDERATRWSRRTSWVSGVAFALLLAARFVGDEESNVWFAVIMGSAATAFLLPMVVGRLLRRSDPGS